MTDHHLLENGHASAEAPADRPPRHGGQANRHNLEARQTVSLAHYSKQRPGGFILQAKKRVLLGFHVIGLAATLAACATSAGQAPTTPSVSSPAAEPSPTAPLPTEPGRSVVGPQIDTIKLVGALRDYLEDRGAPPATEITCPGPLEGIEGKTVVCTLTVSGEEYTATFTAQDVTKTKTGFLLTVESA